MGRIEDLKERGKDLVNDLVDDHPGILYAGSYLIGTAIAIPIVYVCWKWYARIEARELAKVLAPLVK